MEFSVKSGSPEKQRSACVVVGVFEPRRLSPVAEQLDKISDGYLSSLLRRGDLEGKPGQMLLLHQVPGVLSERVLLVGCGKERELDERQYKQIINKTITIEVVNLRRTDGLDTSGGGNGLVGMRERAESVGGTLAPSDDGRIFTIRANLPATQEGNR